MARITHTRPSTGREVAKGEYSMELAIRDVAHVAGELEILRGQLGGMLYPAVINALTDRIAELDAITTLMALRAAPRR